MTDKPTSNTTTRIAELATELSSSDPGAAVEHLDDVLEIFDDGLAGEFEAKGDEPETKAVAVEEDIQPIEPETSDKITLGGTDNDKQASYSIKNAFDSVANPTVVPKNEVKPSELTESRVNDIGRYNVYDVHGASI